MPAQQEYEQAISHIEKLYPAPQVLSKAFSKMQDPNVEVHDIVELLKTDASLSADIIRLSNSAYFGFESECSNLSAAINRVGFREVIRLIGITIADKLLNKNLDHYAIDAETYWAQSVSCALLMEGLSIHVSENPQDAYLIGLLHAVGMVAINQIMDNFKLETTWDTSSTMEEWERDMVGFNHSFAGATLLKRWNFPNTICHPIIYQNRPPRVDNEDKLQSLLYLSIRIIQQVGVDLQKPDFNTTPEMKTIMDTIELEEEELQEILSASRESFVTIKNNLKSA